MKFLLPMIAFFLPLLTLAMVASGRAGERNPPTVPLQPEVEPVELPADSTIRCPLDHKDAPEKREGAITSLTYSPDGKTLAAGNISGVVKLFDSESGRSIFEFRTLDEIQGPCGAVAFGPDGRALAAEGERLGQVATRDPATGREIRRMETDEPKKLSNIGTLAFSPDGKVLACGQRGGQVLLLDVGTGRLLHALPPYTFTGYTNGPNKKAVLGVPTRIRSLAFSPDGATLYSASYVMRAWDVATGQERPRPEQPERPSFSRVAISADGKTLAGGSDAQKGDPKAAKTPLEGPERSITLWDAASGRRLSQLPTTESITGLAFLPGGKALVSLDARGVVRLWDPSAGQSTAAVRFERHFKLPVLAVSPDGKHIAAGGQESNWIFGAIALIETDGVKLTPWKPKP